jgi:hypothetical protein
MILIIRHRSDMMVQVSSIIVRCLFANCILLSSNILRSYFLIHLQLYLILPLFLIQKCTYTVANNTGPYTPSWQTYPMLPTGQYSAYNFNAIQHKILGPGIRKVIDDHTVVIGPVLNFEDSKETG